MKNRTRRLSAVAAFTLVLSASPEAQNITSAQLAAPLGADPTRWLHYSGDYSGQRHSPLTQVTPGKRESTVGPVGISNRCARKVRNHAAGHRRHPLPHRTGEQRLGDRRANRPADLALSASPSRRTQRLLRSGQSRLRGPGRPALPVDARCSSAGIGHEDRRDRLGLGHRRLQARLHGHRGPARRQGQDRRGHCRRGVRHSRVHRRL